MTGPDSEREGMCSPAREAMMTTVTRRAGGDVPRGRKGAAALKVNGESQVQAGSSANALVAVVRVTVKLALPT